MGGSQIWYKIKNPGRGTQIKEPIVFAQISVLSSQTVFSVWLHSLMSQQGSSQVPTPAKDVKPGRHSQKMPPILKKYKSLNCRVRLSIDIKSKTDLEK